jgi:hypothetical protein
MRAIIRSTSNVRPENGYRSSQSVVGDEQETMSARRWRRRALLGLVMAIAWWRPAAAVAKLLLVSRFDLGVCTPAFERAGVPKRLR